MGTGTVGRSASPIAANPWEVTVRGRARVAIVSVGLFAIVTPAAARPAYATGSPKPVVVVAGGPGTVTAVLFEFPSDADTEHASAVMTAVARALGTNARPGKAVVRDGVRRYQLNVNLAHRESFASSRVDAGTFRTIADASHEPVAVEVRHGFHVVSTGPVWNVLTQHPGIDQRVARLAAAHDDDSPAREHASTRGR